MEWRSEVLEPQLTVQLNKPSPSPTTLRISSFLPEAWGYFLLPPSVLTADGKIFPSVLKTGVFPLSTQQINTYSNSKNFLPVPERHFSLPSKDRRRVPWLFSFLSLNQSLGGQCKHFKPEILIIWLGFNSSQQLSDTSGMGLLIAVLGEKKHRKEENTGLRMWGKVHVFQCQSVV